MELWTPNESSLIRRLFSKTERRLHRADWSIIQTESDARQIKSITILFSNFENVICKSNNNPLLSWISVYKHISPYARQYAGCQCKQQNNTKIIFNAINRTSPTLNLNENLILICFVISHLFLDLIYILYAMHTARIRTTYKSVLISGKKTKKSNNETVLLYKAL